MKKYIKKLKIIMLSILMLTVFIANVKVDVYAKSTKPTKGHIVTESKFSSYTGTWSSKNTFNSLTLKFTNSNTAIMNFSSINNKYAIHVAQTEDFKVKFSKNGIGSFSFKEDGWGNSGKGTIKLVKSKIKVTIATKNNSKLGGMYSIFSGSKKVVFEKHINGKFCMSPSN